MRTEHDIETIARCINESEHLVAFTGAGISTDSGIPDFRGPDGIWTRRDAGLPPPRWRVPARHVEPNAPPPAPRARACRPGRAQRLAPGPGRTAAAGQAQVPHHAEHRQLAPPLRHRP